MFGMLLTQFASVPFFDRIMLQDYFFHVSSTLTLQHISFGENTGMKELRLDFLFRNRFDDARNLSAPGCLM